MKYNPAFLDEDTLVQSFVARQHELEFILEIVRENTGESNQHVLIVGPRGMGKTTLALRVVAETQMDEALSDTWYPIVFGEESYQVTTPGEFWLEALFQVGEQTGEQRWQESYEELRRESDEDRLRQRTLAQLMDFADEREKRLLMVVENLNMLIGDQVSSDEAWTLRHTLLNESRIMLLGTATSRFEAIENCDEAMFDLFKIVDLNPIEDREVQALWESVNGEKPAENEVRPIQILTGGNPRLIRIISEFAADTSFRDLMENLTQLVDEHTEYFKRHLDSLSPQERKVFVALADLWDPSTTREVAEAARLDPNRTSAVLGRLTDRGAVTVVDKTGRSNYYQVTERMYNIYHLMRRRGRAASRVRAVVRFMIHLYRGKELVDTVTAIAEEARELAPERRKEHFRAYEAVISMTQDPKLEARIIREVGPLFGALPDAPQSVEKLTPSTQDENHKSKSVDIEEEPEQLLNLDIDEIDDVSRLVKIGKLQSRESNISVAKSAYEKALSIEPESTGALIGLGKLEERRLRHQEALNAFDRALRIDPSIEIAWYGKGTALLGLERYEEALEAFEEVLELDESDEVAWFAKGGALWELDRYEEALGAHEKALDLDETNALAWGGKGIVLEDLGRPEEALKAYEHATEFEGENPKIWFLKGDLLSQLDRHEEALESYDRGLAHTEGTNARIWCSRGAVLRNLERYEQSLESYQRALELDEANTQAWRGKGITLNQMGRFEKALKAYSRILELDETDAHAHQNRGLNLWELGQHEKALEALDQALEYDEESAGTWLVKGVVLGELGQYEEALEAFEKTVQLEETIAGAWRNKGVTLEKLGRYKKAVDSLHKALDLDSNQTIAWRTLLRLYTEHLGKPDEALNVARSYLKVFEHSPEVLNSVGWLFSQTGWPDHLQQAETWIRKAIDQEPDNRNYRHTLASILGAQEKWEEAFEHASSFLENPEVVEEFLDAVIDFFVAAAAAGQTQEALRCIQDSSSTEALEPLVVALKMDLGEDVTVAAEIKEVASDVLDRIEARREEQSD
jgi:tetratricopeptide (TPR) repeat protein